MAQTNKKDKNNFVKGGINKPPTKTPMTEANWLDISEDKMGKME
mgnify:CR=1 FL=1